MEQRRAPHPLRSGFTLIELLVVVAIIGILAALGVFALGAIRERDALTLAPRQFIGALENARNLATATGRDTVLVVVGNKGAAEANACRRSVGATTNPASCVRYWILEDVVSPTSARFDDAALAAFDPAAPNAAGDRVLQEEFMPDAIYIGRYPGFVLPAVDPASIYAGVPFDKPCSFCASGSPLRGYVRFRPDGRVQVGSGADPAGGAIFFDVSHRGEPLADVRVVVILQPSGLLTDRLGQAGL